MAVEYNTQPTSRTAIMPQLSLPRAGKRMSDPLHAMAISYVEHENMRFLIHDVPTEENLQHYVKEFKKYCVSDVVRVCEPTYSATRLGQECIQVHDWKFDDGGVPPSDLIRKWLELTNDRFLENKCVSVHCVAGLGRAPVLVAIALIESGMKPLDAIEYIRRRRRGGNYMFKIWLSFQ